MTDLQNIADHLGFELDDVKMLTGMFLESAYQSLQDMNEAIETDDHKAIKNAAHAIKGSSANLMLENITTISSQIEESAKNGFDIEYKKLSSELKTMLDTLEQVKEPVC